MAIQCFQSECNCYVFSVGIKNFLFGVTWNRLNLFDPITQKSHLPAADIPHLEFFFGDLYKSPYDNLVASVGWVWHPMSYVHIFDVEKWAEDPSKHHSLPFYLSPIENDWITFSFLPKNHFIVAGSTNEECVISLIGKSSVGFIVPCFTESLKTLHFDDDNNCLIRVMEKGAELFYIDFSLKKVFCVSKFQEDISFHCFNPFTKRWLCKDIKTQKPVFISLK